MDGVESNNDGLKSANKAKFSIAFRLCAASGTDEVESTASMNRSSTLFLQVVIVLAGIGALALLLWEPHIEGRNAHATLYQIYFNDPFLAYAYIASTPFFVALYQAFRVLGYARKNKIFSQAAIKALRTIRQCALTVAGFIVGGEAYLFVVQRGKDDIAGGVAVGFVLIFLSIVVAAAATVFENLLRSAVDMKFGNDLTV